MDILKFGYKYYKRHVPLAIVALFMGFVVIGIGLLFPLLSQIIIDFVILPLDPSYIAKTPVLSSNIFAFLVSGEYGENGTMQLLINIAVISVILMAIKHILLYSRNMLHLVYGFKNERLLRKMTFEKLLNSSNAVLARYNTGDLMTILASDTVLFRDLFMRIIPNIIDALFFIAVSIYFLFSIYPPLALLPLTVLPFQTFLFIKYIKNARKINSDIRTAATNLSMNVQENINGIRIVRSFAAEEYEVKKFSKSSSAFKSTYFNQSNFVTRYGFGFNFFRHSLYLICIATGSIFAMQGIIGIGAFLAFITYVFTILDHTISIVNHTFEFQHYMVSGERIYTFINTGNIIDNPQCPISIDSEPNIKVQDLSLIIDSHVILKDINIDIPYGKKLGIMGKTSSGKTSLLNILTRFVDPVSGNVFINGVNLKDIDLESVRKIYSYVMQDVFLFSNTVDSNIAFYNYDLETQKVQEYAKQAAAYDFINKMPEGFETIIGERGIGLSGGQKQRVSIARALAKQAPVIMLDDVTSALDTETERELLNNIFKNYSDKTLIISAHRATSVKDCDEIIFLENGIIVERGTHRELMQLGGRYFSTYSQQTADFE